MNNKIVINQPYIKNQPEGRSRLCSEIEYNGKMFELWYETSKEYDDFLCYERADAFVVNLLLFAMEHSCDILCKCEMTTKLYYQLTTYLIPCISQNIKKYSHININAKLTSSPLNCAGAIGTGISGGVDSFYTLIKHINQPEEYKLTHLVFCNAGTNGDMGGGRQEKHFIKD